MVRFSINGLQGKQSSESQSLFVTKGPEWQTSAGWLLFAHHLSAQSRTLCLTSLWFTCSRIVRPNPGFMVPMVTWAILILFFHLKFTIDTETEMILQLYLWVKQNKQEAHQERKPLSRQLTLWEVFTFSVLTLNDRSEVKCDMIF